LHSPTAVDVKTPDLTVIIPYFWGNEYIRAAIASVDSDARDQVEIIVINDSPEDEKFQEIAFQYQQSNLHFLTNSKNIGVIETRQIALAHAKGAFVRFLDQDDAFSPSTTTSMLNEMKRHGADICIGKVRTKTSGRTDVTERRSFYRISGRRTVLNELKLLIAQPGRLGATMFRRAALDQTTYQKEQGGGEEWLLFWRLLMVGKKFLFVDSVILLRNEHGANISERNFLKRQRNLRLVAGNALSNNPLHRLIFNTALLIRIYRSRRRRGRSVAGTLSAIRTIFGGPVAESDVPQ
jgi:glycosyltransferase involved in cell wall biosynthesis